MIMVRVTLMRVGKGEEEANTKIHEQVGSARVPLKVSFEGELQAIVDNPGDDDVFLGYTLEPKWGKR